MSRSVALGLCVLACVSRDAPRAIAGAQPDPVAVESPDGRIRIEVVLKAGPEGDPGPHYRASFDGLPVVLDSPLGIELGDGTILGADSAIEGVESSEIDERYRQHPGKRSEVVNRANEVTISFLEAGTPRRRWQLVVRAANDGVAYRYRFPEQPGWDALVVAEERSTFTLPEGALAVALPLNGFESAYEDRYRRLPASEAPADWLIGLPLLLELPAGGFAAITEADLTDYAGMYLVRGDGPGARLVSRLSPLPDEPEVAVRAELPHETPWRAILISPDLAGLVESDFVLNLNDPCKIGDVSWIEPGMTTFPWWNGFFEEGVSFEPGLNTETAKYYIDFCAEAGIPYHSLDGIDNLAWYGGPIRPYEGAGITEGREGLDFQEVLRHAETKGVRIRLWMHWEAARAHMERAFPLYREWGVEGVMLDFMNRDDQEMVNVLQDVLELAAANHLTVTLHGASKPTGLERTYPNLLSSEAVLNLEYDKWDPIGVPPEHELTIPFTRMLAGPLDFHQGSFRTVPVPEFEPRYVAPLIMGTPCRTLASYVVFQNHLPMVADYPSAYRDHPALPVLASIPSTWDETKLLSGSVGESIVIARRRGEDWWVGAMTDREARNLPIPLSFLGPGRFGADLYQDDLTAPSRLSHASREVSASDLLDADLAPSGGAIIHLSPVASDREGARPH